MATAALVLGIVAFVLIWLPIVSIAGIICAVVGLILGILGLRNASGANGVGKGQAIAGIVLSGLSILILILAVAVFTANFS